MKPVDGLPGPYGFLVTSASPSATKHHGGVALSKHEHIEIFKDFSRTKQSFLQKFALQQHPAIRTSIGNNVNDVEREEAAMQVTTSQVVTV